MLSSLGIVHNDLKPQNLMWSEYNKELKILDFEFAQKNYVGGSDSDSPVFLYPPKDAIEEDVWREGLEKVGGGFRGPFPPGIHLHDRYVANRTVRSLKMRQIQKGAVFLYWSSMVIRRLFGETSDAILRKLVKKLLLLR